MRWTARTDISHSRQRKYEALISAVIYAWSSEEKYDTQYQKAIELVLSADSETTEESAEEGKPVSAVGLQGNDLMFEADLPDTILKRCHDETI